MESSKMSVSAPSTNRQTLFTEKVVTETLFIYVNLPAPQHSSVTTTSVKFHNEQPFFSFFLILISFYVKEETGLPVLPMSWSPTLFSGSRPVALPPCSLDWRNYLKVAIFRPTRRSLLPWRPGWTDNLLIFFLFEWLGKVTATG